MCPILCFSYPFLQTFLPSGIYERQQRGNPITKHKPPLPTCIHSKHDPVFCKEVLDERTAIEYSTYNNERQKDPKDIACPASTETAMYDATELYQL